VELSLAVVVILVGDMKGRTQFWKGTTQGSVQQSLVEIGSVVSEEKWEIPIKIFLSKTICSIRTKF
jgi:hypothetical protein